MSRPDRHTLERLRYWQGQTLRSLDFRDQARIDARRRELHDQALHSVDGVSIGLSATMPTVGPPRVRVECGLAYDCYGRALVLQQPGEIAIPDQPGWLILRVRAATPASSCCTSSDPGCMSDHELLLDHDVELVWVSLESFEPLNGVALAKFSDGVLDTDFRPRQARALARPRLARGQSVRGNTPWEPWAVEEPDGFGGLFARVVGVQTRIDTSAAGFTETPCYFASVDTPAWDVATAEFAPAFFPHVADPSVDGFTFRLLMVQTARRRYPGSFETARVQATSRGVGERLQITVDAAASFKTGDVVAQLRPRARSIVRVATAGPGLALTLMAPLSQAQADTTMLAIGSFPRVAQVGSVDEAGSAMVATFTSPTTIKKNDILLRTSDRAIAVISSVSQQDKKITVNTPFLNWIASDPVAVARLASGLVTITSATQSGQTTSLVLKPASHVVEKDLTIVVVDSQRAPLGGPRTVMARVNATIEVSPPLTAAEIAVANKKVAIFNADVTIATVEAKSPGMVIGVDRVAPFKVGDIVAAMEDPSVVATIKGISPADKEITLDGSIHAKEGGMVAAASWYGATTVSSVGAAGTNTVVVGRADAVPARSCVARREDDELSSPVAVKQVNGATVTLAAPIDGLARLDTLAVGVFPSVVTVVATPEPQQQIQILETDAGRIIPGDHVALLVDTAATAAVAQVVSVNANTIVLNASLGALNPGQRLGVIHFRDATLLTDIDATDPTSIEVDREIGFREGDVVGILSHYADHSNPGFIEKIAGQVLTLTLPGIDHGDGIVDDGWIDGGIIGPATLRNTPSSGVFPSQFQPWVRLVTVDGITPGTPAIVHGFDLLSGRVVSRSVAPIVHDRTSGHAILWPLEASSAYRIRPETLSLITTFNTDFPRAFATFAQKQQLAVSWIGCQQEFPRPDRCPGQHPYDPCPETESGED